MIGRAAANVSVGKIVDASAFRIGQQHHGPMREAHSHTLEFRIIDRALGKCAAARRIVRMADIGKARKHRGLAVAAPHRAFVPVQKPHNRFRRPANDSKGNRRHTMAARPARGLRRRRSASARSIFFIMFAIRILTSANGFEFILILTKNEFVNNHTRIKERM